MMKSKKIVLVNMPDDKCLRDWRTPKYFKTAIGSTNHMPLGLLSLATSLGQNHEIIILDARNKGLTIDETIQRIEQEKPDILGFSANTMRVYALKEFLKRTSAPYKMVGGPHVNKYSGLTLRQGADAVFIGSLADLEFKEAVETMPKGIIRCNTKYNKIQFPDRTLIDYESYYPKEFVFFKSKNRLHMLSSIGCPQHCNFCNNIPSKMERKSIETIVNEMEHLYSIGSRSIHFMDDNFNVSEKYLNDILDEMDKRSFNVEWSGRGQARMSDKLAKRLFEHNFKRIHVGIEALDDKILRYFKKDSSVKQIDEFCNTMNKNNIDVLGFFIVGTPIETEDYLDKLPKRIKELGIKHAYIQILSPTPDSEYYRDLLEQGVYKTDIWAEYFENPVPDFQIPYPYSSKRLEELGKYIDKIEEEYILKSENDQNRCRQS